ncbi:MAG: hypothetical protein Q7R62_02975, partial [bacterium]|nr:hypothetical protein [bacterium]
MDNDIQKTPSISPTVVSVQDQNQDQDVSLPIIPSAIYDHLNSEATLQVIYALEKEFIIPSDKIGVIPFVLGALVTGEMEAKNVPEAFKIALGLKIEDATKLAGEIKDKILNPIAGGLLLTTGIDLEPIPGPSAKDAKDLPALLNELEPYLTQADRAQTSAAKAQSGASSDLEPLTIGPEPAISQMPPKKTIPGMETPGLRMMKDVKPPAPIAVKKTEPAPLRTTNYP